MENVIKVLKNSSYKEFEGVKNSIKVDGVVFKFNVLERECEDTDCVWPSKINLLSVDGQQPSEQVSRLFQEVLEKKWVVWLYTEPNYKEYP